MTRLTIATFNVLHGQPPSGARAEPAVLQSAVAALDADIIGLQELDRHQPRSGDVDQLALIGDALEAPYRRFVPVLHGVQELPVQLHSVRSSRVIRPAEPALQPAGGEATPARGASPGLADAYAYGIGLASRLPVVSWHVLNFPPAPLRMPLRVPGRPGLMRVPDEPRAAVAAVVDGLSGPFTVINAHLSFVPGWNVSQLRRISRWAARMPAPRLLIGDFNLPGGLPRTVTGWRQLVRAATYPSYRPRVQFDHILAHGPREVRVHRAEAVRLAVSDHCALVVDVEF